MTKMMAKYEDFGAWGDILKPVIDSDLMEWVLRQVDNAYGVGPLVLPGRQDIFRAFREVDPENFKVLVLGQDPYPNVKHANGVAFAVPNDTISIPPSLRNILAEVERSTNKLVVDPDITLYSWCRQGVLLLNSALTVVEKKPGSHAEVWNTLVASMIDFIVKEFPNHPLIVFGRKAEGILTEYTKENAYVLYSPHPAAAVYGKSKGAIGSDVFKTANYILTDPAYQLNKEPVDWTDNVPF